MAKCTSRDSTAHSAKLMPVYNDLHTVLFQQLEQLWNMLHSHEFSKAAIQQLDEKMLGLHKC